MMPISNTLISQWTESSQLALDTHTYLFVPHTDDEKWTILRVIISSSTMLRVVPSHSMAFKYLLWMEWCRYICTLNSWLNGHCDLGSFGNKYYLTCDVYNWTAGNFWIKLRNNLGNLKLGYTFSTLDHAWGPVIEPNIEENYLNSWINMATAI